MAGRLGIDFGTSNTVLALWDETSHQGVPLHIPEYGFSQIQNGETISIIPSLIHYAEDSRIWIGQQVIERSLQESPRTLRWMKKYISNRSPIRFKLGDREITPQIAGKDFLSTILLFASQQIDFKEEEVALSVPVEAFEHYENWLVSVAEEAGMPRFRLIDEPSAAALGYGAQIQPGNVYLIFDFGGGTMHASVILIESEDKSQVGRRCRVLGKSGKNIGGTTIDQWLFQDILQKNKLSDGDPRLRPWSTALLVECQHLKENLSSQETASLVFSPPESGLEFSASYTREQFEAILDEHEFYLQLNHLIRSAVQSAAERGYKEDEIQAVLMVGGSSQIPSVQRTLRQSFGKERVFFNRPLDAVARGAAAFVAGIDFYDYIQHDYAIRYINSQKQSYDYYPIVKKGTPYPTREPVSRLSIKASYNGQTRLGVAIFEVGEKRPQNSTSYELVFDPNGSARLTPLSPQDIEERTLFWMNENSPTFLNADPPGVQGEPRFDVEFNIDANKRLLITARDLKTGKLVFKEFPVVRLT